MRNVPMTKNSMDTAAMLHSKGVQNKQIMDLCQISNTALARIIRGYKAADAKDTDALRQLRFESLTVFEWACERGGIRPEDVLPEQAPKPEPEPKPDNTAKAFTALVESIKELTAAVNAIDKRLSAMQLTQQGFRGDMQQQIGKVIEAVNVNGDILTKEHDKMVDLLGGIKSNTKRGPAL